MKKIILSLAVVMSAIALHGQSTAEGILFANENLTGTARFRALSGAFGALGGDLSAIAINPASSAVFLQSKATVSLSGQSKYNDTFYENGLVSSENASGQLNQAGGVLVFRSRNKNNPWKRFSIALNYDQTNNFDDEFFAFGTSNNSISNYFVDFAQGVPLELLQLENGESISDLYSFLGETQGFGVQQAFLGFQGFIVEPSEDDPNNTVYTSNVAPGTFDQEYAQFSDGGQSKFTFNAGAQYKDKLYIGLNLNAHYIDYRRRTVFFESNSNSGSDINEITFENTLQTFGDGFSAQLGAIYTIDNKFRVGFTYDTPTYYEISEESVQFLETFSDANGRATVNPNVINVFPDYEFRTPGRLALSGAVLFGNKGLISFDYGYKDYKEIEFDSDFRNISFSELNNQINTNLQAASTYRLGGEYRFDNVSLRGGFRYEESPYKDEQTLSDLTGYSFGFGYNFGNITLDLAYDISEQDANRDLLNTGISTQAQQQNINSTFVASLSFGL